MNPIEHPLTPIQQGMLFHHVSGGHPGVDLEQIVCDLREDLDAATLEAAWQAVVGRHESLRTEFHWEGLEEPRARILPAVQLPWTQHDWRGVSPTEQASRFAQWLQADREAGFTPARGPLMRFALWTLGEREHRLVWSFHHLLLDGRSFAQVLREVFTHYDQARAGAASAESGPARSFREHVQHLRTRDGSGDEAFWRGALAGWSSPTTIALPTPPTPLPEPSHDRGAVRRILDTDTTRGLRELAASHGLSLNNVVQGAFALLLSRYSGAPDVLFGCIRACRRSSVQGAESIVGTFINTLPLRVRVDGATSLIDWLVSIRAQNRALAPHEQTPLVDIQRWCNLPAGRALFDALLIYDEHSLNGELRDLSRPGHEREFVLHERTVYPLTLYAYGEDALILQLAWDRTRFEDAAMQRAMEHLSTLLRSFCECPAASLAEHGLSSNAERAALDEAWRQSQRAWPQHECLPDQFEAQVHQRPDATAVVCGDEALTYRELDRRADQLAWHLRELGVEPGTLVGLCLQRSVDLVVALFAIHKAGGAYLPLDPDYPTERLAFQVEDARAAVLIAEEHTADLFPDFRGVIVRVDADAAAIGTRPSTRPPRKLAPRDLAYVIYTSGSTGKPKGVMVEHGNVVNFCTGMDERLGVPTAGTWLAVTSLSFDISVLELFWTLTRGLTVVLYTGEDRRRGGSASPPRDIDFSLFYFASDEAEKASDKYRLLLEGA